MIAWNSAHSYEGSVAVTHHPEYDHGQQPEGMHGPGQGP